MVCESWPRCRHCGRRFSDVDEALVKTAFALYSQWMLRCRVHARLVDGLVHVCSGNCTLSSQVRGKRGDSNLPARAGLSPYSLHVSA